MAKAVAPDGSEHHALIPVVVVKDVDAVIEFYKKAFGFEEIFRVPGEAGKNAHGQVRNGDTILFIAQEPNNDTYVSPQSLGGTTGAVDSYWDDCDAAFKKAVIAGAVPITEPIDLPWGDPVGLVRDPFGHLWPLASRSG